ncbi:hypothetical protein [Novosphingobium sp. SG720]|uniref:hypothetical protein n=1 Tax=Novosphingobium sp. SG720 TaxID=2586998 RepID=UPI0014481212|nr:hypothetical protein [Novosphingobium sp. SG720]NKJ45044.1 hypothetical protein [Novosphingobium sp. SG720]
MSLLEPDASLMNNIRQLNPELAKMKRVPPSRGLHFATPQATGLCAKSAAANASGRGLPAFCRPRSLPQLLLFDEPTNHLDLDRSR